MDPKKFMTPVLYMVKKILKKFEYDKDPKKDQKARKSDLDELRRVLVDQFGFFEEALRSQLMDALRAQMLDELRDQMKGELRKEIREEDEQKLAEKRHKKALKSSKPDGPKKPKRPIAPAALYASQIRKVIADRVNRATKDAKEQKARIKAEIAEAVAAYKLTAEFKAADQKYQAQLTELRGSEHSAADISKFNSSFGHVITAFMRQGWFRRLVHAGSRAGPVPKVLNKAGTPEREIDEAHRLIGTRSDIDAFIKMATGFDFASLLEGGDYYREDAAWWANNPEDGDVEAAAAAATAAFAPKSAAAAPEPAAAAPEPEPATPKAHKAKGRKAKAPEVAAPAAVKTRSKAKAPEVVAPPAPAAAAAEESDGDGDEYESANEGTDDIDDGDDDIEEEAA
jgi:hypothetical protein